MKIFRTVLFTLIFVSLGYLFLENYKLKVQNEYLIDRDEVLTEKINEMIESDKNLREHYSEFVNKFNDLYTSLYASSITQGGQELHDLYISDEYYKKEFTKSN